MRRNAKFAKKLFLLLTASMLLSAAMVMPSPASAATLFSHNFNSGSASGWTATNGTWDVVVDGSHVYRKTGDVEGRTYAGNASWTNYSVEARIKVDNFNGANRAMLNARYQDGNNYYAASLYNSGGGKLEIRKKIGGTSTTLVSKNFSLQAGTWYTVKLEVNGSSLNMYVNGALELSATDGSLMSGRIGLVTQGAAVAKYDDIVVADVAAAPGVNMDSFFTNYRDFSSFVTGNLTTDTNFALNITSWQMPHGGFFKGMEAKYQNPWNGTERRSDWVANGVELGTFDNDATVKEIRFLADMYKKTNNTTLRNAVRKGVDFILNSQYASGGWPQVYPQRNNYSDYVTFNDNAMIRVMVLVDDIVNERYAFDTDVVTSTQKTQLAAALNKGISYILNSQIVMNGTPTVWCAQHDPVTYAPRGARAYELPSKSGSESVGITAFLMSRPQTPEIRSAALNALAWFDQVRTDGVRYNRNGPVFFEPDSSSVIWYRFYNLENNNHFFADRDGQKYYDIMQISEERRLGYSWAGSYAKNLLQRASSTGYYTLSHPLP